MGRDPRNEDDAEAQVDIATAIRAAKTAAATGRAPEPQATAKIGAFDLQEALEKSRDGEAQREQEGAKLEAVPDPPVHAEAPPVAAPPAVDAVDPAAERPSGLQKLQAELLAPVPPPKDLYRPKEDSGKASTYQTWLFLLMFAVGLALAIWFVRSM